MEGSYAYDFTTHSDITILQIFGAATKSSRYRLAETMGWMKKTQSALGKSVNVMIITDGENPSCYFNFLGIPNVCNGLEELSTFIDKKVYELGKTKRTIVYADCAGVFPALITSTKVKYHSMIFTTPYFRISDPFENLTVLDKSMAYSNTVQYRLRQDLPHLAGLFDCLSFLDRYIREQDTKLDIHYAKRLYGNDLKMRNLLSIYNQTPNVSVTNWEIPSTHHSHRLESWLSNNENLLPLIISKEVSLQEDIIKFQILS